MKSRVMLVMLVPRVTDYKTSVLYKSSVHAVRSGSAVGGQFGSNFKHVFPMWLRSDCQSECVGLCEGGVTS